MRQRHLYIVWTVCIVAASAITTENHILLAGELLYFRSPDQIGHSAILPISDFVSESVTDYASGPTVKNTREGESYWGPYSSLNFKPGSQRVLFQVEYFMPYWQSESSMLFGDMLFQADDNNSAEMNLGLGFRTIRDGDWIIGTYAYYDRRRSQFDNFFNQLTFGLEALSVDWEARINGYIPLSSGQRAIPLNRAVISDGTIVVMNGEEHAYHGVDAEIGTLLLRRGHEKNIELRGYLGGFHFATSAAGFPNLTGPRVRMELRLYHSDSSREGPRITFGTEVQRDQVRKTQFFGSVNVQIPFGPSSKNLSPLKRRMLDRPVRDIDIVTHAGSGNPQPAVNILTGKTIDEVIVVQNGQDLKTTIESAPPDSVIVVNGNAGRLETTSTIQLKPGQMLLGGGSVTEFIGNQSGEIAPFRVPGSRPTINNPNVKDATPFGPTPPPIINLAHDTLIEGIDFQGGEVALAALGVDRTVILNNDFEKYGIIAVGTNKTIINDNHFQKTAILGINMSEALVRENQFDAGAIQAYNISRFHLESNTYADESLKWVQPGSSLHSIIGKSVGRSVAYTNYWNIPQAGVYLSKGAYITTTVEDDPQTANIPWW